MTYVTSLNIRLITLMLLLPFFLLAKQNKMDTTIFLSQIQKMNTGLFENNTSDKYSEDSIFFEVNLSGVTLKYGEKSFEGSKIENGYEVKKSSFGKFDSLILESFSKIQFGVIPKGKKLIFQDDYSSYANLKKHWKALTVMNRIGIESVNVADGDLIQQLPLRDAMFTMLISSVKRFPKKKIALEDGKVIFYDEIPNKILLAEGQLKKEITIPLYKITIPLFRNLFFWLFFGSLLGMIIFAILFFVQKHRIVDSYNKAKNDFLPGEVINHFKESNVKGKFSPEELIDHLVLISRKSKSQSPSLKSDSQSHNLNDITDKINELNKSKEISNIKLVPEIEQILKKLELKESFIKQAFPENDKIQEIINGKGDHSTKLQKIADHLDKTYSCEFGKEVSSIKTNSDTLKLINKYVLSERTIANDIKSFADIEKPSIINLSKFLDKFKFKNTATLFHSIDFNDMKVNSINESVSDFEKLYTGKGGLNLIKEMAAAFNVIKKTDASNTNVNSLEKACLEQLSKAYVLENVLAEPSAHNMKSISERETSNLKPIVSAYNVNVSEFPLKDKMIDAFISAKNAEKNEKYLTNYYNMFNDFVHDVGNKSSKEDTHLGWFVQQLIEMALFGFALSTQVPDSLNRDKRLNYGNYISLLENKKVTALAEGFSIEEVQLNNSDIYVRLFVKFAKKFHVSSLENVLIDGYLISDETYKSESGMVKKYSKT